MTRGNRSPLGMIALFVGTMIVTLSLASPLQAKYASFILDADTGEVHHSVNAQTRNYPASLTKMMTLYLLFEALDTGKVNMNTRFAVSARAARQPASHLGLRAGQSITVEQAILALIVKSANDVATVVAEALGGSERKFALVMTATARKIGMDRTTFRNASGLPHRGQLSTAEDMAALARALLNRFPHYYHYFSRPTFTYNGHTFRTHNRLLKRYGGVDGLKTGYIRASGFNIVTSIRRNGQRLIGVVFGGKTARKRDYHMVALFDKVFLEQRRARAAAQLAAANIRPGQKPEVVAETKPAPRRQVRQVASATPTNSSGSVWGIQVGAYYKKEPALAAAYKALNQLGTLADGGEVTVMPLKKSRGRVLYRARIIGLGRRDVYRACRLLKRQKTGCLELRLPPDVEFASTGSSS